MNYFERAKKFRAKKRLGQNFLVDKSAIETILDVSDIIGDHIKSNKDLKNSTKKVIIIYIL